MHKPRWQMDWPTPICLGAALQEKKEFNFQELIIILEWKGEWPNEGETIDVYTFCRVQRAELAMAARATRQLHRRRGRSADFPSWKLDQAPSF